MTRWVRAAVGLALSAFAAWAAAQGTLQCRVDSATPVLGRPLTWTLTARDTAQPLPDFSAASLRPEWLLTEQQGASGSDAAGHREQSAALTLIALRSGRLTLPEVRAGSARCPAQSLDVAPAAAGEAPLQWRTQMRPVHPYALQPLRVELWVIGAGNLAWTTPPARSAQARLVPLDESTRTEVIDGTAQLVQVFAWQVLPLQAGAVTVDFGLVRARAFGQLRVYAPPPLQFDAWALPLWWPADGLIGAPHVQVLQASTALRLGQTGVWRLRLSSPGLDRAQALRLVNAWTAALPPAFGMAGAQVRRANDTPASDGDGWDIDLYLRPQSAGRLQAPALRLDYFDPRTELPATARWQPPAMQVDDLRMRHLALGLLGAAGVLGLLFGLRAAVCQACRRRARRAAWRAVARADTPTALLRAWLKVPTRAAAPAAATLQDWLQAADVPETHALRRHAERLQHMLYLAPPGNVSHSDLAALAAAVHEALRQRR
ncbi:BatD family protein [Thiomonas intermedia]|uniref:BatD family protein n=1 Tax=Thiomonas intermedia TaxID=926 RepID=UPI0009A52E4D|nr:BatD family protein [Thiomonas intermedia]